MINGALFYLLVVLYMFRHLDTSGLHDMSDLGYLVAVNIRLLCD